MRIFVWLTVKYIELLEWFSYVVIEVLIKYDTGATQCDSLSCH